MFLKIRKLVGVLIKVYPFLLALVVGILIGESVPSLAILKFMVGATVAMLIIAVLYQISEHPR